MLDERQQILKQRLLEQTRSHYQTFINGLKQEEAKSIEILSTRGIIAKKDLTLDFDPFATQMWHQKFDPHSIPDLPCKELSPKPGTN